MSKKYRVLPQCLRNVAMAKLQTNLVHKHSILSAYSHVKMNLEV